MSENINEIAGVEPSFKIDELKFNEKDTVKRCAGKNRMPLLHVLADAKKLLR